MAVTYVSISREELEEWLSSLDKKWSRDLHTAGIYYIHLSESVAVKLSSTQTSSSGSMGYADASMKLSLVSLVSGQLLNKKDADRSHFKRTLNWRKTWKEGVEHWISVYQGAKSFYDKIAIVTDRYEYKKSWMDKIERVSNWEKNTFLKDLHDKLDKGSILSDAQEEGIMKFLNKKQKIQLTPEQQRMLVRFERLAEISIPIDRTFTLMMIDNAVHGVKLTDEQKQRLIALLKHYGV